MSALPQRKKSAEEIAKLREGMGLPVREAVVDASQGVLEEVAAAEVESVRPVRSFKRSENTEDLVGEATKEAALPAVPTQEGGRVVRSLRKSERVPIVPMEHDTPPARSKLPVYRHNGDELSEIRRQSAIQEMQSVVADPRLKFAHPVLVIPGYVCALGVPAGLYFYDLAVWILVIPLVLAAAISGFIFLRKPMSRHHGAFIVVIVVFVVIFGALHFFPQLRYGT